MRPLEKYRADYYFHSGKASDVARTLALSGLAVIWIFRETTDSGPSLPNAFFWPALLIVLSLAFDLLQYTVAAAIWGRFARQHEKLGKRPTDEVTANRKLNWPALFFFWSKLGFVILAYVLLLKFLLRKLFPC